MWAIVAVFPSVYYYTENDSSYTVVSWLEKLLTLRYYFALVCQSTKKSFVVNPHDGKKNVAVHNFSAGVVLTSSADRGIQSD